MKSLKVSIFASTIMLALTINPVFAKNDTKNTPAGKLSTAEIGSLATIAAIDKSEILLSIIASNKKPTDDVDDFAKMMIEQHGSNLTQIMEMANNLHAVPLQSNAAEQIKSQSKKDMLALGALQGTQFEKSYADAMVKGHQAALNMIDNQLLKTAKNADVKKFITDTRAAVVQHLEDAKKMQAELNS